MKFGHVFKQCLRNEGFPPEWVDSAISYSQLKKVINRLTHELQHLGLDPATLSKLLKHVEDYNASADQNGDQDRPFEYILNGHTAASASPRERKPFHPKLLFYVNEKNGDVDSASIDEETKRKLQMLAVETGMTSLRVFEDADSPSLSEADSQKSSEADLKKSSEADLKKSSEADLKKSSEADSQKSSEADSQKSSEADSQKSSEADSQKSSEADSKKSSEADLKKPSEADSQKSSEADSLTHGSRPGYRTVEVPLTSDTEFFTRLTSEVAGLEKLQEREEKRMHAQIESLGSQIAKLTDVNKRSNKKTITAWRQVFQMYIEEGIFFGTTEQDHKSHDADKATRRLAEFSNKVARAGLVEKFKKKENMAALNMFMHINREILQGLRFGEINHNAMIKILKKFDKRTALGVKQTFPRQVEYPEFSEHLAKAVCAEVNTRILSHVPQLDDYSCPMCCEIEWRPVKLSCGHVFCIRCLIVMQNNKQHNCPYCRAKTVFDANSDNLDNELAAFLKKWFPDEVKAKQRYNEHMAGIDQYGEVYADQKCVVM